MESFIPDEIAEEAANAPSDATSEAAESVRMEPGYYHCHPVWAKDTKKDGTPVDANNIAVRIGFRPYETAAFGAEPEPCPMNAEIGNDTIILLYGPNGKVWDNSKHDWRPATDKDSEEAVAKMARIFPEWAAFETDDPAEKVAWFVTHIEEFRRCSCLCKLSHTVSRTDGKEYTNCTLCEEKKHTADIGGISQRMTRNQRAVLSAVMKKPSAAAKKPTPSQTSKPVNASAHVPPPSDDEPQTAPAPAPVDTPTSSKAECWQLYCEVHPSKGRDQTAWQKIIGDTKYRLGKSLERDFSPEEWGAVRLEIEDAFGEAF